MKRRVTPRIHRRDWRRLWRYCRCGYRWRCPDSVDLVPDMWQPRRLLPGVTPDRNSQQPRVRPRNRGPLYPDQVGAMAPVVRAVVRRR